MCSGTLTTILVGWSLLCLHRLLSREKSIIRQSALLPIFGPKAVMPAVLTLLISTGTAPVVASDLESPIEEIRQSEPIGANQLLLRSVYQEPVRTDTAATWRPVASARTSGAVALDFEIRDNRELGYLLKYSMSCLGTEAPCQFEWASVKLDSLRLGPGNLWTLARRRSSPIQFQYVPVCLCSASNSVLLSPVHLLLVPTRTINLSYVVKTEGGAIIKSESLKSLPAGRPFEITIGTAIAKPPAVLKVRLNHVAIQEGEVERLTDNFDILWAQ